MKEKAFATEAALCAAFIESVDSKLWAVYPETAGFDLLLVRIETGHQLGIEAKLTLNAKVCDQILPDSYNQDSGPDWRGVVVGSAQTGISKMLGYCGVIVLEPQRRYRPYRDGGGHFWDFDLSERSHYNGAWLDWNPKTRCILPEFVPDVPAGVPCPIQLTPWKIGALKVLAEIEVTGSVTRTSIRAFGVDPRRFCGSDGWLAPLGEGRWGRGKVPAFDVQHPDVYRQLCDTAREALSPTQPALALEAA